jgi:alpha-L-fucosidase 2
MVYEAVAKVIGQTPKINYSNHTMIIEGTTTRITVVIAAGTDFDQTKGNVENNFSFRGNDPSTYVQDRIDSAAKVGAANLEKSHVSDYAALANAFILDLPDTQNSSNVETNTLVARYNSNLTSDPYLESLSFDYARHLFISSSRDGSLPPNLQGRWATELTNEWGSDYHANINLQMNHWGADQTGLGSLQTPLWKYMQHNWAPRGAITARLLYNAPGWVVHNEMNIFGFGGMKTGDEIWADYPVSAAWMMQHVWDYYEYSQDVTWLQETGYPLLASISEFWLSELQDDQYFKDGTLVVNPCTSAEHGPTTFGCTHYQQLLHQLFETTLEACSIVGSLDSHLPTELLDALAKLDTGLHVGSWGQIQEWKLDLDRKNDTHRHLSNLIGWYPGWSIASYADGYKNNTIRDAVRTTLESRGLGIVDANAGWEKVWRAAAWARLNDADKVCISPSSSAGWSHELTNFSHSRHIDKSA